MTTTTPTDPLSTPTPLTPDAVRDLAERSVRRDSVPSFQALLAALTRAVEAAAEPVARAEGAALSLRQRETVGGVLARLEAAREALAAGVSAEGACLKRGQTAGEMVRAVLRPTPGWLRRRRAAPDVAVTWVGAAAAAVEALGETAQHARTLASAQPAASCARALGEALADALTQDRDALLAAVARVVD